MPKFLDPVNALAYQYNGKPGYLMSEEEYAAFQELLSNPHSANAVEKAETTLLPNEEGILTYTVPEDVEGTLLSVSLSADGFGLLSLSINSNEIYSERNSYARPSVSSVTPWDLNPGDVVVASVRNTSVFGQTNAYKIFLYLSLRPL